MHEERLTDAARIDRWEVSMDDASELQQQTNDVITQRRKRPTETNQWRQRRDVEVWKGAVRKHCTTDHKQTTEDLRHSETYTIQYNVKLVTHHM